MKKVKKTLLLLIAAGIAVSTFTIVAAEPNATKSEKAATGDKARPHGLSRVREP